MGTSVSRGIRQFGLPISAALEVYLLTRRLAGDSEGMKAQAPKPAAFFKDERLPPAKSSNNALVLELRGSPVYNEFRADDIRGLVAGEEERCVSNILGPAHVAQWDEFG